MVMLQQYLPFTVLKLLNFSCYTSQNNINVATVLTVYGIETIGIETAIKKLSDVGSCNSTYRLRY